MIFGKPFLAILGLVLAVVYIAKFFQLGKRPELVIPTTIKAKGSNGVGRFVTFLIGLAGVLLITFSLAQPRRSLGFAKNDIEANDIFLVVDVSLSMLAEDFKPNRLVVAKNKIRDFVRMRPTDRIGIIIFSEKAFTLLPLSTDLKLIDQSVDDINVGFLGSGTNIGDALALGVGRASQSLAKNKVVVLLTDGVSNVGSMTPIQAAEEAKKAGVKVYSIGIGQRENKKSLKFGRGQYQRLPGGSVDLETLEKISEMTGGKSFYAGNEKALSVVMDEIQNLEKTKINTSGKIVYEELYWSYLLYGLLMLLIAESVQKFVYREVL